MTDRATAEIIAFPQRQTALVPASPVQAATNRLSGALTDQHEALVAWRDALVGLRDSLQHLGRNLRALESTSRFGVGL